MVAFVVAWNSVLMRGANSWTASACRRTIGFGGSANGVFFKKQQAFTTCRSATTVAAADAALVEEESSAAAAASATTVVPNNTKLSGLTAAAGAVVGQQRQTQGSRIITTTTILLADHPEFITPERDPRTYRAIQLPNNLQVLLVCDEMTAGVGVEAASVHVQAGHFDDTIPGLARTYRRSRTYVVVVVHRSLCAAAEGWCTGRSTHHPRNTPLWLNEGSRGRNCCLAGLL